MTGRPKKALGQNFLTDVETARTVVRSGRIEPGTPVLEVGPGRGFLTRYLLEAGAHVVAIEKDRDLAAALPERFPGSPLEVIVGDLLEIDLDRFAGEDRVAVGNLPYNVGSAILRRTLDCGHCWPRLVFMFQWEVAHRITAPFGSRDVGMPTVLAGLTHRARVVRRIRPGAFFPKPKVDSALVLFEPREEPLLTGADRTAFLDFSGQAWRYRRKTAANALSRTGTGSVAHFGEVLTELGFDPRSRLEELPLETLVALWRSTRQDH